MRAWSSVAHGLWLWVVHGVVNRRRGDIWEDEKDQFSRYHQSTGLDKEELGHTRQEGGGMYRKILL